MSGCGCTVQGIYHGGHRNRRFRFPGFGSQDKASRFPGLPDFQAERIIEKVRKVLRTYLIGIENKLDVNPKIAFSGGRTGCTQFLVKREIKGIFFSGKAVLQVRVGKIDL
jgi:hypothetical protein